MGNCYCQNAHCSVIVIENEDVKCHKTETVIYSVDKLIKESNHIQTTRKFIGDLENKLNEKCWFSGIDEITGNEMYVSPAGVLIKEERNVKEQEHFRKIWDCDINEPILIIKNSADDFMILRGMYQLAKSYMLKKSQVFVKVIDNDVLQRSCLKSI